jgi:hypothetical protein
MHSISGGYDYAVSRCAHSTDFPPSVAVRFLPLCDGPLLTSSAAPSLARTITHGERSQSKPTLIVRLPYLKYTQIHKYMQDHFQEKGELLSLVWK